MEITFDAKGGTKTNSIKVECGKELPMLPTPTRNGYRFVSWADKNGKVILKGALLSCENVTLYANWEVKEKPSAKTFTVTYDSKGGSAVKNSVVTCGENLKLPANPTRENYKFINWCTDKLGQNEFDFSSTAITASITLYANWEQEFAVYFDLDNGTAVNKVAATLNAPILMNVAPSVLREGYQFLGWYNGDTLYNFATPVTAVLNLKAHWKAIASGKAARTVTIDFNAGDAYQSVSFYVEDGATTFTPSNPVIEGKEFLGWSKDARGGEAFDFTAGITADTTIYARYKVDFYTVNFKYVTNDEETVFKSQQIRH